MTITVGYPLANALASGSVTSQPVVPVGANISDAGSIPVMAKTNPLTGVIEISAIGKSANTGKTRVLIVGSSNAAGNSPGSYAQSWAGLLAAALSTTHDFYNVAIIGKSAMYWTDQDPSGLTISDQGVMSNLELAISKYQPHIVIGSFGMANGLDTTITTPSYIQDRMQEYIAAVLKAKSVCDKQGIRFISSTPYGGNAFSALAWRMTRTAGDVMVAKGLPCVDFFKIYYQAGSTSIPPSIDSGDGQHLNAAGHMLQFQAFPLGWLRLKDSIPAASLAFPSGIFGLLFPNDNTTALPIEHATLPGGNWTVGLRVKGGASLGVKVAMAFSGANGNQRIRSPASNAWDVNGNAVISAGPAFVAGEEQHLALAYNAIAATMSFYVNGLLIGTSAVSNAASTTFTGFSIGGNTSGGSFNATGYSLRNLSVHACCLNAGEIKQLSGGDIPTRSLYSAYPLIDGYDKVADEIFVNIAGNEGRLVSHVAIA